jgi:cytochrome b pre-mRNA-processing protein 3
LGVFGFLRRGRHERTGYELYTVAVGAAREPWLYAELGVPDTVDGRFDLVGLHVFLVIRRAQRLATGGKGLAQAVFDAMFNDMDVNLREMGVGDLSVGKKVKVMWEAFNGRAIAYGAALDAGDPAALAASLVRNVWRGRAPDDQGTRLAAIVAAQEAHLAGQDPISGQIAFLAATEAEARGAGAAGGGEASAAGGGATAAGGGASA